MLSDLAPGETLLWSETPARFALLAGKRGIAGIVVPVVIAVAFATFGFPAWTEGGWFFSMFAVFLIGSLVWDISTAKQTLYCITDKRLIIVHPSLSSTVLESYYPPDIDFLKKKRRKSGAGSIVFAAVREKKGKRTETVEIGFFGIKDVNFVESLICQLRKPLNA